MKKTITVLAIIFTINCSGAFSQSLPNTTWTVYDTTGAFFVFFHFGADTLFFSDNGVVYTAVSTYQENGNNFSIVNLPGAQCTDTGFYTFFIQSDTLKFTIVNEPCMMEQRHIVIAFYHWVRNTSGIQETNAMASISIYPNPTRGSLTIPVSGEKNIVITNLAGQIVKTIKTDKETISVSDLGIGNYFVSVYDKDNKLITQRQIVYQK